MPVLLLVSTRVAANNQANAFRGQRVQSRRVNIGQQQQLPNNRRHPNPGNGTGNGNGRANGNGNDNSGGIAPPPGDVAPPGNGGDMPMAPWRLLPAAGAVFACTGNNHKEENGLYTGIVFLACYDNDSKKDNLQQEQAVELVDSMCEDDDKQDDKWWDATICVQRISKDLVIAELQFLFLYYKENE